MFGNDLKDYIRLNAPKLRSMKYLQELAKNPTLAYTHAKKFFLNRNLEQSPIIYKESIIALATMSPSIDRADLSFERWLPLILDERDACDLDTLLRRHGSDKSTYHDYHRIYASVLRGKREKPLNILEIGLGSNNLDVPSSMGFWGKPGASLRAFRDWAPNAQIFGADVDERILFQEERISTFWVDQTNPSSLLLLSSQLDGTKFDLIIDDGLHLPHANFNTLSALLGLLSEGGVFVVEDIDPVHKLFWRLASAVLSKKYETYLAAAKYAFVFVIRASAEPV